MRKFSPLMLSPIFLAGAGLVGVAQLQNQSPQLDVSGAPRPQSLVPSAPIPSPAVRINEDPFYDPSAPERVASSKPLHPSLAERIAAWDARTGPKTESEKYLVEEITFRGVIETPQGLMARVSVKGVSDIFSVCVGSRFWNGEVSEMKGFDGSGKSPCLILAETKPKRSKPITLELHPKTEGGKNAF
jgi:hypothetical protein